MFSRFLVLVFCLGGWLTNSCAQSFLPIKKNGLWGFVDSLGHVIVEPQYQNIGAFNGDYCTVCQGYDCGVIHKTRGLVIPVEYRSVVNSAGDQFILTKKNGAKSLIYEGQDISSAPVYKEIKQIRENKKEYLLLKEGKDSCIVQVNGAQFKIPSLGYISHELGDYFRLEKDGLQGFINVKDSSVVLPQYESITFIDSNVFVVTNLDLQKGLYVDGNEVLEPNLKEIKKEHKSIYLIQSGMGKGYYDISEKKVLFAPKYHSIFMNKNGNETYFLFPKKDASLLVLRSLEDTLGIVTSNDFYRVTRDVLLSRKDTIFNLSSLKYGVLHHDFSRVASEKDGFIMVKSKKGRLGLVNKYGKLVLTPIYKSISRNKRTIKAKGIKGNADLFTVTSGFNLKKKTSVKKLYTLSIGTGVDVDTLRMKDFDFSQGVDDFNKNASTGLSSYSYNEVEDSLGCLVYDLNGERVTSRLFKGIDVNDFNEKGFRYARAIFPSGRVGLVSNKGKILASVTYQDERNKLVTKSIGYVGKFNAEGFAVFNVNTALNRKRMSDFEYNNLLYRNNTYLSKMFHDTGLWGVLNSKGKVVLPPRYRSVTDVKNGRFFAENSEHYYGALDIQGTELIPFKFSGFKELRKDDRIYYKSILIDSKWELMDPSGNAITFADYDKIESYSQGYFSVRRNRKWTVLDSTGKEIRTPYYEKIGVQNDGLVPVRINNLWGYMNLNGEEVISPQYSLAGTYQNGVMYAKKEGKYGVLNGDTTWLIKPRFKKIYEGRNGFFITKKGNKVGVLTKDQKWLISASYSSVRFWGSTYLLCRDNSGLYDVYDLVGFKVVNKAEKVKLIGENFLSVRNKNKKYTQLLNKLGEVVIDKKEYKRFHSYSEGYFVADVKSALKMLLDTTGSVKLNGEQFKKIGTVSNGIVSVQPVDKVNTKSFYVNVGSGDRIMLANKIPNNVRELNNKNNGLFPYKTISGSYKFRNTSGENLFEINNASKFIGCDGKKVLLANETNKDGKRTRLNYSVINTYGFELAPMIFSSYKEFDNDYLALKTNKKYGVFDEELREVVEAKYELVEIISPWLLKVYGGGKTGYYNLLSKSWVWSLQD